jgi:hypothetical protein
MCGGFSYQHKDPTTGEVSTRKVFFPNPKAQAPVILDDGIHLVQWGKRKGQQPELDAPETGWARLESLTEGKWKRWSPRKVKILVLSWMEKDATRESHWFDMAKAPIC